VTGRITLARVETDLGPMILATSERGILAIEDGGDPGPMLAALVRRLPGAEVVDGPTEAVAWLQGWVSGTRRDAPPIDLRGLSPFDADVYRFVAGVGWGERVTYGDVAAAIDRPGAARAVGGAMGRCPLFPAVPCHRVVRAADGWLGWGGDERRKRALLEREASG
jgi:O-6-methylguanine DNA methyltransferase